MTDINLFSSLAAPDTPNEPKPQNVDVSVAQLNTKKLLNKHECKTNALKKKKNRFRTTSTSAHDDHSRLFKSTE